MKWISIIGLILFSCSDEQVTIIDIQLSQYVDQFYIEAKLRGHVYSKDGLVILVKRMDCGCDGVTYGSKVFIEQSFFEFNKQRAEDNPQYDRYYNRIIESVVMHELGHAILKKGHSTGLMAGTTPSHLYAWYDDKRKELLDGLFE